MENNMKLDFNNLPSAKNITIDRKYVIIWTLLILSAISISFFDIQWMIVKNYQENNQMNASYISAEYSKETSDLYTLIDKSYSKIDDYDTLKVLASECKQDNIKGLIIDCKKLLKEEENKISQKKPVFETKFAR